jgi:hypothetical protein
MNFTIINFKKRNLMKKIIALYIIASMFTSSLIVGMDLDLSFDESKKMVFVSNSSSSLIDQTRTTSADSPQTSRSRSNSPQRFNPSQSSSPSTSQPSSPRLTDEAKEERRKKIRKNMEDSGLLEQFKEADAAQIAVQELRKSLEGKRIPSPSGSGSSTPSDSNDDVIQGAKEILQLSGSGKHVEQKTTCNGDDTVLRLPSDETVIQFLKPPTTLVPNNTPERVTPPGTPDQEVSGKQPITQLAIQKEENAPTQEPTPPKTLTCNGKPIDKKESGTPAPEATPEKTLIRDGKPIPTSDQTTKSIDKKESWLHKHPTLTFCAGVSALFLLLSSILYQIDALPEDATQTIDQLLHAIQNLPKHVISIFESPYQPHR